MSDRAPIRRFASGVSGLDEVLGGGIPEFSFNVIGGGAGGGKITMAHQIMFANAGPERKGIYFSIVGEPPATVELQDRSIDLRFSPSGLAFLTDAIVVQRYIEIDGRLPRALAVVKVRPSQHRKELFDYEISSERGVVVGKPLHGYDGLSGTPRRSVEGGHH